MKPLFYLRSGARFAFAAEIKAILAAAGSTPTIDRRGVVDFLSYGHLLESRTLFENVQILPAAHVMTIDPASRSVQLERYWRPEPVHKQAVRNHDEILEGLDQAFQNSVERCTRKTSGLGISLSGGLDGRAVTAAIDHDRI